MKYSTMLSNYLNFSSFCGNCYVVSAIYGHLLYTRLGKIATLSTVEELMIEREWESGGKAPPEKFQELYFLILVKHLFALEHIQLLI